MTSDNPFKPLCEILQETNTNFIPEFLLFIMQLCLQETSQHSDSMLVQIRDPR